MTLQEDLAQVLVPHNYDTWGEKPKPDIRSLRIQPTSLDRGRRFFGREVAVRRVVSDGVGEISAKAFGLPSPCWVIKRLAGW